MNSKPISAFQCDACGRKYDNVDTADRCCTCSECGKATDRDRDFTNLHRSCSEKRGRLVHEKRFATAERVTDWAGWVYSDHINGSNDGYFATLGDFLECLEDEIAGEEIQDEERIPTHVYCTTAKAHRLDVADLVESFCDGGYEDMDEAIVGRPELWEAVENSTLPTSI